MQTQSKVRNYCAFYTFLSNIELRTIHEALADSDWAIAMQEEFY